MSPAKASKESVDYSRSSSADKCECCRHWRGAPDARRAECEKVQGLVERGYWCKKFGQEPVVYLVRHGKTEFNRGGAGRDIIRGHLDKPLTQEGLAQARKLGRELSETEMREVYTSDLSRARRTAEIVANYQRRHVKVDPTQDLRSWDLGPQFEGKPTDRETVNRIRSLVKNHGEQPTGGENFKAFVDRVLGYVKPIFAKAEREGLVCAIVAHGRTLQVIDLWVEAGCDEECLHRDHIDDMLDEPDAVGPGGFVELVHRAGKWRRGEVMEGAKERAKVAAS
jgi:broad specificity phosphatase PhoE